VGSESEPQEIAINDQPGILYGGFTLLADLSDPVQTWNPARSVMIPIGMTLIWDRDATRFIIFVESTTITKEEILRLAESIP